MINYLIHHNPQAIMTTGGLANYLMSRSLYFDSTLTSEIIGQWKLTCGMWALTRIKIFMETLLTKWVVARKR
ncbi:hypothetical protein NEOC84_000048|uniref:hypothetical protein n=1 Tax=Neochlamydia sp. AcF84 TaxID=2315858 RepID=UPI00140906DA|nr:hypothetical protein [Neochlamydia sp. AcF84]NGY94194.1 hypothetical protein [Neochlamydia sp. AcF84]